MPCVHPSQDVLLSYGISALGRVGKPLDVGLVPRFLHKSVLLLYRISDVVVYGHFASRGFLLPRGIPPDSPKKINHQLLQRKACNITLRYISQQDNPDSVMVS